MMNDTQYTQDLLNQGINFTTNELQKQFFERKNADVMILENQLKIMKSNIQILELLKKPF